MDKLGFGSANSVPCNALQNSNAQYALFKWIKFKNKQNINLQQ